MSTEAYRQMMLQAEQANTEVGKKLATDIAAAIKMGIDKRHFKETVEEKKRHPEITLNMDLMIVIGPEGKHLQVSPKESQLLCVFLSNMGRVCPVAYIHNNVSGWEEYGEKSDYSPIKGRLNSLRKKLVRIGAFNEDFPEGYVLTVPNAGYFLVNPQDQLQRDKYIEFARVRR